MFIVTAKITRPDPNDNWYIMTSILVPHEVRTYWQTTYKATQKCMFVEVIESSDNLEMTNIVYWDDEIYYTEYKNDSYLTENLFTPRTQYWQSHGMTYTIVSETTV